MKDQERCGGEERDEEARGAEPCAFIGADDWPHGDRLGYGEQMRTLYERHFWQTIFDFVMDGTEQDELNNGEQKMDLDQKTGGGESTESLTALRPIARSTTAESVFRRSCLPQQYPRRKLWLRSADRFRRLVSVWNSTASPVSAPGSSRQCRYIVLLLVSNPQTRCCATNLATCQRIIR